MRNTKELVMEIQDIAAIKSVVVNYENGETVSGMVKNTGLTFNGTLEKHSIDKGEEPYHNIDFNSAVSITLHYYDNRKPKIFE
jgi:hypothetical protein